MLDQVIDGIIEAPSFNVPTVDIGSRQQGRVRAQSVLHSDNDQASIQQAIKQGLLINNSSVTFNNPTIAAIPVQPLLQTKRLTTQYRKETILYAHYVITQCMAQTQDKHHEYIYYCRGRRKPNGSLEKALQLVDVAVAANADAVKFNLQSRQSCVSAAGKANYQKKLPMHKKAN